MTLTAREIQVTVDCADPAGLAGFWAETLGYVLQPPPEGFADWDAALDAWGVPPDQRNDRSALVDPDGGGPRMFFQRVPEGKTAKNRLHLDVRSAPGVPAERTYADALVDQINPETGRVHTRFAMAVASTGRLSSTDPNLQNIPIRTEEGSRIRRAFIAEPGHVLVSCDYSQIELRLLAHVAEIPQLRESFLSGEDIHARTASEVFGLPMEGMDPMTRRRAKAINFGIIYGISPFGLGRQLGITPGEARFYIDAYFARYPGIRAYMERTKEEARIAGYVVTPFGRRCWIAGIADRNPARRGYAERQAINAPLQGGAADIIKRAMVRLPAALREAGLRARLLLQVHDELLFEAPEDEADALAATAKRVMEAAARISVPLLAETGKGRTWAEAH